MEDPSDERGPRLGGWGGSWIEAREIGGALNGIRRIEVTREIAVLYRGRGHRDRE
jgi:hypothetical protein